LASEAASAILAFGFKRLGLPEIVAVTHPDNAALRRVLEKIGLRYSGPAHYYDTDVSFYRLSGAAYESGVVAV
jgi:RimJ/RimL family protein N-acetyltransferase